MIEASTPPSRPGLAGPLSPEDLRALTDARRRMKSVRRAAGVATLSGWTLAIFAGITMLGVIFGDLTALVLGVALGACAANELRGASMLRRLDRRAPATLGWNQVALGALIVVYAGWSLFRAIQTPALASVGGSTGDPHMDHIVTSLTTTVMYVFYSALAATGIIAPGLTALYYFTRARHIRRVLGETPVWVMDTLRAAA